MTCVLHTLLFDIIVNYKQISNPKYKQGCRVGVRSKRSQEFFQGVGVTKNIHYSLLFYCIIGLPYCLEFLEHCN